MVVFDTSLDAPPLRPELGAVCSGVRGDEVVDEWVEPLGGDRRAPRATS